MPRAEPDLPDHVREGALRGRISTSSSHQRLGVPTWTIRNHAATKTIAATAAMSTTRRITRRDAGSARGHGAAARATAPICPARRLGRREQRLELERVEVAERPRS